MEARPLIDWLIVGGESGPNARPMNLAWARSLVRQAASAGVAVFVKQLGARPVASRAVRENLYAERDDGDSSMTIRTERIGLRDRKGGDLQEFPDDLKVREFPPVGI